LSRGTKPNGGDHGACRREPWLASDRRSIHVSGQIPPSTSTCRDRFLIDARIRQEVIAIHRATQRVMVKNLDTGEHYGEG
jgi:hypothetical protein